MRKFYISIFIALFLSVNGYSQVANFTYQPVVGQNLCDSSGVQFTSTSSGATGWSWSFGSNAIPSTSTSPNPIVIFPAGTYDITLTITPGGSTITKQIVVNPKPVSCFTTTSPNSGCSPLTVTFDASCSTPNVSYQWDFCDGQSASTAKPSHTFVAGQSECFCVKLYVTDANGCQGFSEKPANYICSWESPKISIQTTGDTASCNPPLKINQCANLIKVNGNNPTYSWSFPGGVPSSSTAKCPIGIAYSSSGTYTANLTVTDINGCKTTISNTMKLKVNTCKTFFTTSRKSICACESIQFINPDTLSSRLHNWYIRKVGGGVVSGVTPSPPYSGRFQSMSFCTPGQYIVTDSVRFGPKDIVGFSDTITVVNKPTGIDFSVVGNTTFCTFPQSVRVNVTGNTSPTWKYRWDIAGATVSGNINSRDPGLITFNSCGVFSINLIVTDTIAQCDTIIEQKDIINITCPEVEYATLKAPVKGQFCLDSSATFNASPGFTSYCWKFTPVGTTPGSGCDYTVSNVNRKFSVAGCYNVSLTVKDASGCTATTMNSGNPTVGQPICFGKRTTPCFDATPKEVCARDKITFSNCTVCPPPNTNPPACTWCWNFGDGGLPYICQSVALAPSHTYSDTGYKDVTLIACNFGCCDTLTKDTFVNILPPIAKIDVTVLCDSPAYRIFSATKSVGATTYSWTFPNGTIVPPYTAKDSVVKVFWTLPPSNISYFCTLTVSNKNGCTNQSTYQVLLRNTHAIFSLSDSVGCAPLNTSITNLATGNPTASFYIYRNATCSQSDSLLYSVVGLIAPPNRDPKPPPPLPAGVYRVKMLVQDVNKCIDSSDKKIIVSGTNPAFKPDTTIGCAPLTVRFTNLTDTTCLFSKPPLRYRWKFGDGTTSSTRNPSHTYTSPGIYSVTLIVTDGNNCVDSIVAYQLINVRGSGVNFSATDTTTCVGNSICFTSNNSGSGLAYDWDFGDGSTHSDLNSPCHVYTSAGKFSITLTLMDANGCAGTLRKVNYITIGELTGAFRVQDDSSSLCPPFPVTFLDRSRINKSCAKYNWSFGDGTYSQVPNPFHIYSYSDSFTVKLVVTDTCLNCSDTIVKIKHIAVSGPYSHPQADPDTGCATLLVNFDLRPTNSTQFIWNFGDNSPSITGGETISHAYTDTGRFIVTVVLTDSAQGSVNPCTYVRVVDTIYVVKAKADFSFTPSTACTKELIYFSDLSKSSVGITKWRWFFGDGDSSNVQNPVHSYKAGGNYQIKLIATPPGACSDTVTKSILILDSPIADFTMSADSVCPNTLITFTDASTSSFPIVSWRWKFDGIGSATTNNTSYIFTTPGDYDDSLFVVNTMGCKDTAIRMTHIFPFAVADAGPDISVCINNFSDTIKATGGTIYLWRPGTGLSDSTVSNPEISPVVNTTYTLYVTDANGCKDDTTVAVSVKPVPHATVSASDSIICFGTQVMLRASGGVCYEWQPGGSTDSVYTVSPASSITYTVVVCNSDGCTDDTTIAVDVLAPPPIDAGQDVEICINDSVQLNVTSSSASMSFVWSPGETLSDTTITNPIASPIVTTTYSVTGRDSQGCSSSDQVVVKVNLLPVLNLAESINMCLGFPVTLKVSGAINYDWTPRSSIISGATTAQPLVFPADTTYFFVTGTDSQNCSATDSIRVDVLKPFNVSISNDTCVCPGESAKLTASGGPNYTYKWAAAYQGGLSETNTCCPVATPKVSSTYTVVVSDPLACFTDTETVKICLYPSANVEAGKNEYLLAGTSVKLSANNINEPGTGTFIWIPDSTLSCSNCQSPVAHPLTPTTYTVTLIDKNGCKSKDSLSVDIFCNEHIFSVPNAFTPNGDGKNDVFMIQGEGVDKFHLTIWNRWGEKVFESYNLKQGWDGTVKGGKISEPAVFIYTIEATCGVDGETILKSGNVTLLR